MTSEASVPLVPPPDIRTAVTYIRGADVRDFAKKLQPLLDLGWQSWSNVFKHQGCICQVFVKTVYDKSYVLDVEEAK
jgi:hypothetical protein